MSETIPLIGRADWRSGKRLHVGPDSEKTNEFLTHNSMCKKTNGVSGTLIPYHENPNQALHSIGHGPMTVTICPVQQTVRFSVVNKSFLPWVEMERFP